MLTPEATPAQHDDQPRRPPAFASGAVLPRGVNCCRCGYELEGLGADSNCPECFTRIAESLRGDALVFAPLESLRRLRRGAELTTWCTFTWVMLLMFGWVLVAIMTLAAPWSDAISRGVLWIVQLAAAIGACWGVWLLTAPDPSAAHTRRQARVTWSARWVVLLSVGLAAGLPLLSWIAPSAGLVNFAVVLFVLSVGWGLLLRHVSSIYTRARAAKLAGAAGALSVLLFIAAGMVIVYPVGSMLLRVLAPRRTGGVDLLLGICMCIAVCVIALTLLGTFVVFVELGWWINRSRIRAEIIRAAVD